MRILVVDDSRAMRRIVTRLIRQAGYPDQDVVEAENGREALASVHEREPDVILADWRMPEMSGIELLDVLNEEGRTVPFGFIVSEPTRAMVERARAAGAVFLLAKPFTAADLAKVLGLMVPA